MRTAFVWLLVITPVLRAEFPKPKLAEASTPFPPIQITKYEYDQPRPLRAWAARIDLANPDIEFVVSPRAKVDAGFETSSQTTLAFAEAERVQMAINGSPFTPFRQKAGESMKIDGLQLSRGDLVSPANDKGDFGAAFSDVRRNRRRCASYLTRHTEQLRSRILLRYEVRSLGQFHALFPNQQVSIRLNRHV